MCWALAGGALFAALACFEVLVLRPGLGAPEELFNLGKMLDAGETWRFWFRIGGGALSQTIMALALACRGPWQSIYVFNAVALAGAGTALWKLTKSLDGEEAAGWALALAFSAPFSFLQARTTFTYVLAPVLVLVLVAAARSRLGRTASFVAGMGAVLAWLDYEGWLLAFPALAAAWWTAGRRSRPAGVWLFWGALAGAAIVSALEAPYLREWLQQRGHAGAAGSTGFLSNVRSYFFGGFDPKAMGLEGEAAFPWLAWPGLAAGLLFAPSWLWIWAALGMLGLAAGGPMQEPNRAIVAWPALLIISGIGSARLMRLVPGGWGRTALKVALVAAPFAGYIRFDGAISRWDEAIHGPSRRVFAAARFLADRGRLHPVRLGGGLDLMTTPLLRRLAPSRTGVGEEAELWVLVPRAMADPLDARWGRWAGFSGGTSGATLWLLNPSPRARTLLEDAAKAEEPLEGILAMPGAERLAALRARMATLVNPWALSTYGELRLQNALQLGQIRPDDALGLLTGACVSAAPLETMEAALAGKQPGVAALARKRRLELEKPGSRWNTLFGKN